MSYALECSLERESLRSFKSMLQCLKTFGTDLFFEANEQHVTLRTLNQQQSAFIVFTLQPSFFTKYVMAPGATASVKLHLKNVTSIFRSTANVDRVWLQVTCGGGEPQNQNEQAGANNSQAAEGGNDAGGDAFMRVQLRMSSGLRKKFDLAFHEVTSMNALYDRSVCPHYLIADPIMILDCLKNFPASLPELTMVQKPDVLTIKNEVETQQAPPPEPDAAGRSGSVGSDDSRQTVRTEMHLHNSEMAEYLLGPSAPPSGVSVTFSQKEFKSVRGPHTQPSRKHPCSGPHHPHHPPLSTLTTLHPPPSTLTTLHPLTTPPPLPLTLTHHPPLSTLLRS